MGYESKLYLVRERKNVTMGDFIYAQRIAEICLGKVDIPLGAFFNHVPNYYMRFDGSEDYVVTDCYGEPFSMCTDIPGFIAWLKKENEACLYHTLAMAAGLLETVAEKQWDSGFKLLHYGY